jgi:hypothetical protein
MNTNSINEVLTALKQPFHPSQIYWKPGSLNEDRTRALALAYADLRAYQNRLDEVCGMDWSVTYTPWGDRIVCHLTIQGITRSSTGEPDTQSERSEIAGTAAEAQAFKRACAMFGLGRYLYNLPSLWVEYNPQQRSFTERARARLEMIVNQHYRRTQEGVDAEQASEETAGEATQPAEAPQASSVEATPEAPPQAATDSVQSNGDKSPGASNEAQRQQFDKLGRELYGDQWEHVSRHNVERISGGQTSDSGQLSLEQLQKLIDGLKSLKRRRQRTPANGALQAVAA